ncbi:MAG: hypothetical protein ABJG37_20740 [Ekhidna sp.]
MKTIYVTAIFIFMAVTVFAQGGPPATPIDGGLSFLLAAGGAYGAKKLMDRRKNK